MSQLILEHCKSVNDGQYNRLYLSEWSEDKKWQEKYQEMRLKMGPVAVSTEVLCVTGGSWSWSTS